MSSESAYEGRIDRAERTGVMAIIEAGVLAGLVGASIVAVWFLVLDTIRGIPFATPSLLGGVLFGGHVPGEVTEIDPTAVFAYTGLHGLAFLCAGVTLAWMFSHLERNPQFGMVLLLMFLVFEAIVFGVEVSIAPQLVGEIGTWAVGVANLISAVGMFWFLLRQHPEAIQRLRQTWHE